MNINFQDLIPQHFSEDSRVWVYQANRAFSVSEALEVEKLLQDFSKDWYSHGNTVNGYANLFFGQFIIIMADESNTKVGGCSTDSSVRMIKNLEQDFQIELLDRQTLAFIIKEKIQLLVAQLHLEGEERTLVRSLPLGWKQKLAFSIAIVHDPAIVFLDEPTGGVDPITRREFWTLIYEASARGITIFVTTHYMDEAEYCNRVSIMVDGRIDALDTPSNLMENYSAKSMDEVFLKLARKAVRSE